MGQIGPDTAWVLRQAFIKNMDVTEKGALKFCNKIIAKWDGEPQDIIATGYRIDASHCPLSMTIRQGIGAPLDLTDQRVVTGIGTCRVKSEDGERDETYLLTATARKFASEFDSREAGRQIYDRSLEQTDSNSDLWKITMDLWQRVNVLEGRDKFDGMS